MKPKRTVLLFEDREATAWDLKARLADSRRFEFEVNIASDVAMYARESYGKTHDVYVVDLNLDGRPSDPARAVPDKPLYLGHLIVGLRHFERPDTLIVVFSAHSELEQVVAAIRNGATTFVSKNDPSSHEKLIAVVESLLEKQQLDSEERVRVEALVEQGGFGWQETYAGKVIVVVGDEIKAFGENRLKALLSYRNLCLENPTLPLNPVVLELPPLEA